MEMTISGRVLDQFESNRVSPMMRTKIDCSDYKSVPTTVLTSFDPIECIIRSLSVDNARNINPSNKLLVLPIQPRNVSHSFFFLPPMFMAEHTKNTLSNPSRINSTASTTNSKPLSGNQTPKSIVLPSHGSI